MNHKFNPKRVFEQGRFLPLNNSRSIIKYKLKTSEFKAKTNKVNEAENKSNRYYLEKISCALKCKKTKLGFLYFSMKGERMKI